MDIFLDYARRMELQDKDGNPLIKWHDAESTFGAWKECSRGHLCDYTSMSYARFQGGSGIQWPCNEQFQEGKERLYEDGIFLTDADVCQTYGHDLVTGAVVTRQEYLANDPKGKAILKPAQYVPPHEQPDGEYPLFLTTSRVVYYFHTRTKTGRAEALHQAMPDVFIQISREDADRYDISEGDTVEIESRRGKAQAPARIGDILPGHVFIPFHFGYWDDSDRPRAANELTLTEWDPVSKQPYFKFAAVRLRKLVPVTAGQRMGQMAHRVMEQARETFTSQEARSPSETPWPSS